MYSQYVKARSILVTHVKGSLAKHKDSIDKGKKYPCDLCDHKATSSGFLIIRKESKHQPGNSKRGTNKT